MRMRTFTISGFVSAIAEVVGVLHYCGKVDSRGVVCGRDGEGIISTVGGTRVVVSGPEG